MKVIEKLKNFFTDLVKTLATTLFVLGVVALTIYLVSLYNETAGIALVLLCIGMGKTLLMSLPRMLLLSFGSNKKPERAEKSSKAGVKSSTKSEADEADKATEVAKPNPIIEEMVYDELFR